MAPEGERRVPVDAGAQPGVCLAERIGDDMGRGIDGARKPAGMTCGEGRGGPGRIGLHPAIGSRQRKRCHLVSSLAVELAPQITVNAIAPGQIVDTPLVDEIAPGFKQAQLDATPLKRLVTWNELSALVVLLCSPPFAMMTGQTLVIDGGWSLPLGQGTPVIGQAL